LSRKAKTEQQANERQHAQNHEENVDANSADGQEDRLPGMEAHFAALIVWRHDEENDRRNERHIG
jgi:hypothetical protein